VEPIGKLLPLTGPAVCVITISPIVQVELAIGIFQVAVAVDTPETVKLISAGQVIDGPSTTKIGVRVASSVPT